MNSRPINLARRWRSAGSPILVGKIDRVLQRHEHRRRPAASPHQDTFISHLRGRAMPSAAQKQGGGRRASGGPANADTHGRPRRTAAAYASTSIPAVIICRTRPRAFRRSSSAAAAHHLRNYFCVSACIFSRTPAAHRRGGAAARQRRCSAAARRRLQRGGGGCSAAARPAANEVVFGSPA